MSAWKNPSRKTCVKKMVTPSRANFGMSTPDSRKRSTWLIGMPFMRSITITSVWQKSQNISGIKTRFNPSMLRRSWVALAASRTKSNSSCKYLSNSATTSLGFSRLPSTDRRSTQLAIIRIRLKSLLMTSSMPGRNTFTATSRLTPLRSTIAAKCTCAIDALATGWKVNSVNTSPNGLPNARSMMATACSDGKGGTRSCSIANSSATSKGSKSRRVESTCPNFTKMGPRCSKASRKRCPRGAERSRPIDTKRANRRRPGL